MRVGASLDPVPGRDRGQ